MKPFSFSKDCIFCKIAKKEVESEIVYDDENVTAFNDVNPQAPIHILIIPKKHIEKVSDIGGENYTIVGNLVGVANKLAEDKGLINRGYRLVFNCGKEAGQAVFHLHLHLLGGRSFSWPPG